MDNVYTKFALSRPFIPNLCAKMAHTNGQILLFLCHYTGRMDKQADGVHNIIQPDVRQATQIYTAGNKHE